MVVIDGIGVIKGTYVDGGADVTLIPIEGYTVTPEVDVGMDGVTIRIRKDIGPQIGDSVTFGNRIAIVYDRRYDSHGQLMLQDTETKVWFMSDEVSR